MEPTLVVIGISLRSAKLAQRERFLLSAEQKADALVSLGRSDAVDEVIVISTCNRTEFLVWTQDASEAANSVLRYLTRAINLKMMEWSNFYRLVGDLAVVHVLRVAAGVDAAIFGEAEATSSVLTAWQQAQRAGTTGRFLDAMMTKAFTVAGLVRQEVGGSTSMVTLADAAVQVCGDDLGALERRRIVVLGAGEMASAAVGEFRKAGASAITIVNRSWDRAQHLARQFQVKAAHMESLWEQVLRADAVVSAISQRMLLTREELEIVMHERRETHLILVDLSVPRTVDPRARDLEGITAYDHDDLCAAMDRREQRRDRVLQAERILATQAAGFRSELLSESVLSTITAMRQRLESICAQEMDQLGEQFGPFSDDQQAALKTLSAHIAQRISAALARQLKETPGQNELTGALQQLFQLEMGDGKATAKSAD